MKIQFLLISVLVVAARAGFSASGGSNYIYGGHQDNNVYGHQTKDVYEQQYDPVPAIHNGVPVDTPEVQAAKAAHFEAYAKAAQLAAKNPSNGQYHEQDDHQYDNQVYQKQTSATYYDHQLGGYSTGLQHQYNYAPVDTPEVQQAKAVHYAAVAKAQSHHGYRSKRGIYNFDHYESEHVPHIINGVPEETPEVQLAKQQHLVAHAVAKSRSHGNFDYHQEEPLYQSYNDGHYHIPAIGKDGVPLETPEVQAAKQQHLLAHHLTKSGDHYGGAFGYSDHSPVIGPNGVPFETAEVQIAKAEHFAAHAKAQSGHDQWQGQGGHDGEEYEHYY